MTDFQKVRRTIKSRQAMLGYKNADMACLMHMSLPKWNRRLQKPEMITVEELIRLEKVLKIKLLEVEQ